MQNTAQLSRAVECRLHLRRGEPLDREVCLNTGGLRNRVWLVRLDIPPEVLRKQRLAQHTREWWNWQTRQLEGLVLAIACRFKSCFPQFLLQYSWPCRVGAILAKSAAKRTTKKPAKPRASSKPDESQCSYGSNLYPHRSPTAFVRRGSRLFLLRRRLRLVQQEPPPTRTTQGVEDEAVEVNPMCGTAVNLKCFAIVE